MRATLTLAATAHALEQITPFLSDLLIGVDAEQQRGIMLAVHELCANIVRYAGAQQIVLSGEYDKERLFLNVQDDGTNHYDAPSTPNAPDVDSLPESGWGMVILHQVMDTVEYQPRPDGNEWWLSKQLN
jgi:anti-sigma regulatory factor (Ser/Thr protein kinase)